MDRRESNRRWYSNLDQKAMTVVFNHSDGYFDQALVMKVEYIVCGTCEGKGSHVNPSIDSHGLSREDFDDDPDFAEDYFSGAYDVACNECHGKRVVPWPVSESDQKLVEQWFQDEAEYEAECEAERRHGC